MKPEKKSISFISTDRARGFIRQFHNVQKDSGLDYYDVFHNKRKNFSKRTNTSLDKGKLTVDEMRQNNMKKNKENIKKLIDEHVYKAKMLHKKEHHLFTSKPEADKFDLKDTFFREKFIIKPEKDQNTHKNDLLKM